ncbi:MAG: tripartite tricarboxylate transporter permease [Planctomycetota bacterium]|jgi:putative tricarboxylic transport membrane protein|nr:tripartite tricarboxylate transporter permease [Planctomycetota bacterium]
MISAGFALVLNLECLGLIGAGVFIGIVFGALPGLTATMGVALCLPLTFPLAPIQGISLLLGLYIGGISGGLISAILLKIPGTPSSIATTFDGGPMADKGEAGKALSIGLFYSFLGTLFSIAALVFIAPWLARFTLRFGPYQYFAIGVFSLTMVGSLVSGSVVKGLVGCVLGLCLAQVGAAPVSGALRYTFGFHELDNGFELLPVLVGLFAVSEILKAAEDGIPETGGVAGKHKISPTGVTLPEFLNQGWNFTRSALIGIGIGILPGIGGGTANLIAYAVARNQSKYPEKFGSGVIDGLIASETSNNASIGGALIPLMTLGIPGDTVTAILLGGLMLHGISTGPMLFKTNGPLVYGIFAATIVATIVMYAMEYLGMRLFIRVLSIKRQYLLPVIMILCCVGTYGANNRVFDVFAALLLGVIGFLLLKSGFSLSPFILGFILEPVIETNLIRGMMFSKGSVIPFLANPISAVFLAMSLLSVVLSFRNELRKKRFSTTI